ncbi:hypothetical protein SLA2020_099050 [Shorea laevis]
MALNKAVAVFSIWFACSMLLAISAAAADALVPWSGHVPSPAPATRPSLETPLPAPAPKPLHQVPLHLYKESRLDQMVLPFPSLPLKRWLEIYPISFQVFSR